MSNRTKLLKAIGQLAVDAKKEVFEGVAEFLYQQGLDLPDDILEYELDVSQDMFWEALRKDKKLSLIVLEKVIDKYYDKVYTDEEEDNDEEQPSQSEERPSQSEEPEEEEEEQPAQSNQEEEEEQPEQEQCEEQEEEEQ